MNWESVDSSQINEVGYDLASKTLGIRFKATAKSGPSEYHYASVPPMVHRAMITAESVGGYFAAEIKKRPDLYPYTKMGDVLPPAPENPDSALLKIDKMTPEQIFAPGTMDPILEAIRTEVTRQAAKLDISTEQNRKALGSLAFKVTKSKTFIEGQRKSLVAAEKKRLAAIDSEGRRIWDILEGIAAEVRKPLTDWEQIDKDRVASHESLIMKLLECGQASFRSHRCRHTVYPSHAIECIDTDNMRRVRFACRWTQGQCSQGTECCPQGIRRSGTPEGRERAPEIRSQRTGTAGSGHLCGQDCP